MLQVVVYQHLTNNLQQQWNQSNLITMYYIHWGEQLCSPLLFSLKNWFGNTNPNLLSKSSFFWNRHCLHNNQPCTVISSATQMHKLPVIYIPIGGRILAHRQHNDSFIKPYTLYGREKKDVFLPWIFYWFIEANI